jgi:CheY-like chemotaxis protein
MKRVAIVDDSLEIGRWLQTALVQMDSSIQVQVYPSGEEALMDVLVTDIRLSGMSGLELIRKIRKRQPGIRVIVITGLPDLSLRKQTEELEVDGFFHKPMDIPSFLEAVDACLKLEPSSARPPIAAPAPVQPPAQRVVITPKPAPPPEASGRPVVFPQFASGTTNNTIPLNPGHHTPLAAVQSSDKLISLLAGLRQDLGALAVLILDEYGRTTSRVGQFPDSAFDQQWAQPIIDAVRASSKVGRMLETSAGKNVIALQGIAFDLVLSPIGSFALVLVLRTGRPTVRLALAFEEIINIQRELFAILTEPIGPAGGGKQSVVARFSSNTAETRPLRSMAFPPYETGTPPAPPANPIEEPFSEEFKDLLSRPGTLNPQDLDAFWESAADNLEPKITNTDAISYDQARRLGLAPKGDEEKEK